MSGESARRQPRTPSPQEEVQREADAARASAALLAHQLANLLQVVNGNLELTVLRTTDETTLRYLANARAAVEQLIEVSRTLPTDSAD